MRSVLGLLAAAARGGRYLLVAGLLAGVFLPSVAVVMRPLVGPLIAFLLFLACLRIGPRQAVGAVGEAGVSVGAVVVLQVAVPAAWAGILHLTGLTGGNAVALLLMTAASPIAGSPNLVILLGRDPAPALRQLVVGTALLPLTALVVLLIAPGLGDPVTVMLSAGRLLLVIAAAGALAFAIRAFLFRELAPPIRDAVDGLSALTMAVVVVGLMSAIGETWATAPGAVLATAALAFAANFTLQVATALAAARIGLRRLAVPLGVSAGNRNIALFLTALPASVTDPALLYIACYQLPMYLTPLLLRGFYRRAGGDRGG